MGKVDSLFGKVGCKLKNILKNIGKKVFLAFFWFLAVLSGDYFVVKFVRTYSMYKCTPPCGGQITPCTNPKFRAKKEKNREQISPV